MTRLLPALALALLAVSASHAQPPLHERIDQLLAAATPDFDKLAAPAASDGEFLRRVYLDFTGTIPPVEQARAFLAEAAPDKRAKLIGRLLDSPEFARHMAHVFDVTLMERRPGKHVQAPQFHEFLREAFAANKPWDQLAREVLSADGSDPKTRPAARFFLDREGEANLVTRDLGRVFLGVDLQCAQCHDHPRITDYKQDHYYGIFAFVNRSFLFADKKAKLSVYAEKAEGEATYQSVFDPAKVTKTSPPRMPSGTAIKEPKLAKGEEYTVKPTPDIRPVPKFSRREQLAGEVTKPDNVAFKRNIANRLWAHLMGRGLVHPLDLAHSDNPPSHPELLDLLADEIAARKFDVKSLLREIALSKAYQRSSEPRKGVKDLPAHRYLVANLKPQSPEALAFSLYEATGMTATERAALGKGLNEAALYGRVSKAVAPLVTSFAGAPGLTNDFEPTVDQALFLSNGPLLRSWLAPRAGNLTDRMAKLTDEGAAAEEAYLSVLSRRPTAEERKEVVDYLKTPGKARAAAIQELAWALMTCAEFRFNH